MKEKIIDEKIVYELTKPSEQKAIDIADFPSMRLHLHTAKKEEQIDKRE